MPQTLRYAVHHVLSAKGCWSVVVFIPGKSIWSAQKQSFINVVTEIMKRIVSGSGAWSICNHMKDEESWKGRTFRIMWKGMGWNVLPSKLLRHPLDVVIVPARDSTKMDGVEFIFIITGEILKAGMFLHTPIIYWSYFTCRGAYIDKWLCLHDFWYQHVTVAWGTSLNRGRLTHFLPVTSPSVGKTYIVVFQTSTVKMEVISKIAFWSISLTESSVQVGTK